MAIHNSTQFAAQNSVDKNRSQLNTIDYDAKLRYAEVDITFPSGVLAGDEFNLIIIPSVHKVLLFQSFYKSSASWGAGSQMDIGWRAFTKEDGSTQAQDDNAYVDNADMTVTTRTAWSATPGDQADVIGQVEVKGQGNGITLYMTVRVDPPAQNDTLKLLVAYLTN